MGGSGYRKTKRRAPGSRENNAEGAQTVSWYLHFDGSSYPAAIERFLGSAKRRNALQIGCLDDAEEKVPIPTAMPPRL